MNKHAHLPKETKEENGFVRKVRKMWTGNRYKKQNSFPENSFAKVAILPSPVNRVCPDLEPEELHCKEQANKNH